MTYPLRPLIEARRLRDLAGVVHHFYYDRAMTACEDAVEEVFLPEAFEEFRVTGAPVDCVGCLAVMGSRDA